MKSKRNSQGESGYPVEKKKRDTGMSPDVIVLVHDRIHELNVIPGRHVFIGQRDRLKRDVLWLIDNCQWLLPLVREGEWEFRYDLRDVIGELKAFKDDNLLEENPVLLLSPDRSDRFATLLSHLSNLFPSDFDGELVLGEMRERVFHLQRHWTMMRNAIRQVRDSNGLCHLRKIIEGMGGAVTVKEWSIQEPVIELD